MAQKIILFLSDYKPNAREELYACPGGAEVIGTQTNDAPVKYLLQAYPDIKEILCIVTPEARSAALEPFTAMVREAAPKVRVTDVPFEEGQNFESEVLGRLLSAVSTQKKDEILLETTGGFRNAVMYLLLTSRALSYSGVRTAGAVYSNFKAGRVEDVSHLIGLFNLVGGMQELVSFGSVGTLRAYYSKQERPEPEIEALLTAMERLNEDITLCRTGRLEARMEAFNTALDQASDCADPLMRALLPAFQAKFDKRLNVPGLIKWCLNSGMLQQALTIYKERIPNYILTSRPDLLSVKSGAPDPKSKKEYETEAEARFSEHLLNLGANLHTLDRDVRWENGKWKHPAVLTLERLEEVLPHSYFTTRCPVSKLREILMDYLYIRILRNMVCHANDEAAQSQQPLTDYLVSCNYKHPDQVRTGDVKHALERGLKNLFGSLEKE